MKKVFQLVILWTVLFFIACSGSKKDNGVDEKDDTPKVKLAKVQTQPVEQIQEYTATVEPEVRNAITPSSPVRIDHILVEVGDYVAKGQALVQMDAASLKQAKLQLQNQEIEFKRLDELYKIGGVSKSEWDASKMTLDVKRTGYNNLLENTTLLSPVSGVVTERNYDNGDMYSNSTPILVVEQITPVKLLINVSEMYFTKIQKGIPVSLKLDAFGDEVFEGKVSLIYPTINSKTRTFPVEIKLANRNRKVRPGMFARVTVNFGAQNHVVVPDLAVIKQIGSGDRYVYVYKDGKVYYQKVLLGRRMNAEYELISGVENNSQVVVAGFTHLTDGMEVDVQK